MYSISKAAIISDLKITVNIYTVM